MGNDIYQIKRNLKIGENSYSYYSLTELKKQGHPIEKLPFSIRILLENALRNFDDFAVTKEAIVTLLNWKPEGSDKDIPFKPARVLMQDFTGVPVVVGVSSTGVSSFFLQENTTPQINTIANSFFISLIFV